MAKTKKFPEHIFYVPVHIKDRVYIGKFNYDKAKEVLLTEKEARKCCIYLNVEKNHENAKILMASTAFMHKKKTKS